ncbi:MAG: phosphoribosylaminoimidazolesuccinocarboxamide synthase [Candidatus Bathyarchaeia archaeon]|jgi:phosphoribosylaminoimidazole-succinocarboxamide synthase
MSITQLSAGKTKTVTATTEPNNVVLTFRDDITAGDGKKHEILPGKGRVNATITAKLYSLLAEEGIPTHLLKTIDSNRLLVKKLEMIPVEVVCRIRAAGHFIGIGKYFQNGDKLPFPVVEFYLKDDALHDPMLNDQHLELLRLSNLNEIERMRKITLEVGSFLDKYFDDRRGILVDFKLEFGRDRDGNLMIGDELSPDSWRLWDKETKEILDKDRFRKDLPHIFELGYAEPLRRICGESISD